MSDGIGKETILDPNPYMLQQKQQFFLVFLPNTNFIICTYPLSLLVSKA
jgi:hypothetical protein